MLFTLLLWQKEAHIQLKHPYSHCPGPMTCIWCIFFTLTFFFIFIAVFIYFLASFTISVTYKKQKPSQGESMLIYLPIIYAGQ